MQTDGPYWFPAKQHGWGWGPPIAWQGWVVIVTFVILMVVGGMVLPPNRNLLGYLAYIFALSGAVIAICWLKGEPPRLR